MDVKEFLVKIINRQITAEPEDVALLFYFMIPVRINVSVTPPSPSLSAGLTGQQPLAPSCPPLPDTNVITSGADMFGFFYIMSL